MHLINPFNSDMKDLPKLGLSLTLLGIVLPSIVFDCYNAAIASQEAFRLNEWVRLSASPFDLNRLLEPLNCFLKSYLIGTLFVAFSTGLTYFSIVKLALDFYHKQDLAPLLTYFKDGFRLFASRFFSLLLMILFVLFVSQLLPLPTLFLSALLTMTPVIIVNSQQGSFSSAWSAITLSYTKTNRFRSFVRILTLASTYTLFIFAISWLIQFLNSLGLSSSLPSDSAIEPVFIPWTYMIQVFFRSCLIGSATTLLAIFSTKLFMELSTPSTASGLPQ